MLTNKKSKKKPKKNKVTDLYDASHPIRHSAIQIIEYVIEPLLSRGINGIKYYELEDKLVRIIKDNLSKQ